MTTTGAPAPYRLRSITADDRAGLTAFYAGLSQDSRVARFHGTATTIPEATATYFCGPDHEHREGIVAEYFDAGGAPVIVGHVCIEPTEGSTAEMAIAIADAWQHHGLGRAMLGHAIEWAQTHGFAHLVASMLGGNTSMCLLLQSTGYPVSYGDLGWDTIDAYLDVLGPRPEAA